MFNLDSTFTTDVYWESLGFYFLKAYTYRVSNIGMKIINDQWQCKQKPFVVITHSPRLWMSSIEFLCVAAFHIGQARKKWQDSTSSFKSTSNQNIWLVWMLNCNCHRTTSILGRLPSYLYIVSLLSGAHRVDIHPGFLRYVIVAVTSGIPLSSSGERPMLIPGAWNEENMNMHYQVFLCKYDMVICRPIRHRKG